MVDSRYLEQRWAFAEGSPQIRNCGANIFCGFAFAEKFKNLWICGCGSLNILSPQIRKFYLISPQIRKYFFENFTKKNGCQKKKFSCKKILVKNWIF